MPIAYPFVCLFRVFGTGYSHPHRFSEEEFTDPFIPEGLEDIKVTKVSPLVGEMHLDDS